MDLTDTFRTFHPKTEYTFFSSACRTFSRIDYMLGHKRSFNKFKKTDILSSIFSEHNSMKQEIIHKKRKLEKTPNTWRLNMLLNNQ